jgi:hypothetical protein
MPNSEEPLFDQAADVITASGQAGFKVIDPQRQQRFDHGLIDRLGTYLESRLERAYQVLADLQRRFQLGRQAGCRRVGHDVFGCDTLFEAHFEHPVDIVALAIAQTAELEHGRAVADFLRLWPAQVVFSVGWTTNTTES